jgi:capsular polysaccharide transport system permease protein
MNISTIDHDTLREVVRKSHRQSWLLKQRWLVLFVGLPTVLTTFYYGLIASPIYVSESSFVIKSPGQKAAPTLSLANLVQTSGLSAGQEQAKEVVQYIRSRDALHDLQAQTNIDERFSKRGADFLSRFPTAFHDRSFEN